MNITKDYPLVYDLEIINKIKKMIQEGFEKLNSFVKKAHENVTKKSNFNFYREIEQKFDEIIYKLKELKLCEEFNYFISIRLYPIYYP